MDIYLGVDWSQDSAFCVFGSPCKSRKLKISPAPSQVEHLFESIHKSFPKVDKIHLALEAGSPLWLRLFEQSEAILYIIDGKQAKCFANSRCSSGAKDDRRDADSLYHMIMSPSHRKNVHVRLSPELQALERLSANDERLTVQRTAEVQRLRQQLANTMPGLSKVFSDLTTKTALAFLARYPTPGAVRALKPDVFERFAKKHRMRKAKKAAVWEETRKVFDLWSKEESQAQATLVRQLVKRLRSLLESQKELKEKINALYEKCEGSKSLASFAGVGPGIGSTLLSQVFSKPQDKRDTAAILSGAAPVTKSSGETGKGKRTKRTVHMRKSVSSSLRRMNYLLGMQASMRHDWAKAQYNAAIERGKNAATAYRIVARSVLRILQALVRDKKEYDRDRYVAVLKSKGVEWAANLPETLG